MPIRAAAGRRVAHFVRHPQKDTPKITDADGNFLSPINDLFAEAGRTNFNLDEKLALHAQIRNAGGTEPLHATIRPRRISTPPPAIFSGLTLYSGKSVRMIAAHDVADTSVYAQNVQAGDITLVAAGRDIVPYDPAAPRRLAATQPGNVIEYSQGQVGPATGTPPAGDIQMAGPAHSRYWPGAISTLATAVIRSPTAPRRHHERGLDPQSGVGAERRRQHRRDRRCPKYLYLRGNRHSAKWPDW